MPDSIHYIAPVNFAFHIVIGFPVVEQLKEIPLYQDGRMVIPLNPSENALHNFALDKLDPIISLKTDEDTLCFHLDLGASSSVLYNNYFDKYKSAVLQRAQSKTMEFGGAGGIQKKEVYVLPVFDLYLGNKKPRIDNVTMLTQPIYPGEKMYGNLGQDFVSKFKEIILNFKYMYILAK
jgi:hypothetical protein